ncbi:MULTISPECIES: YcxB family protein [unclassified Microbacterium]|uniref:YcxB family protein n=1 Tax=unclassified Microbacterium TaxID=2609290 RepID=UPI00386874B4
MTDAMHDARTPIAGSARTMIADADLPRRLVRDYLTTVKPFNGFVIASALGMIAVAVLWYAISMNPRMILQLVPLALLALIVGVAYRRVRASRLRRATQAAYPLGQEIACAVTSDGLEIEAATGRAEIRYAAISGVTISGDTVIVNLVHLEGAAVLLPRDLLTDDDVTALRTGHLAR